MVALRSLIVLAALLVGGFASAAYVSPTPPPRFGGTPGAWTFGGVPGPLSDMVGLNKVTTMVPVTVGGRTVHMTAGMALKSNAPQVIARAALFSPLGRAASFIAWALQGGWIWNEFQGRWEIAEGGNPGGLAFPTYNGDYNNVNCGMGSTSLGAALQACMQQIPDVVNGGSCQLVNKQLGPVVWVPSGPYWEAFPSWEVIGTGNSCRWENTSGRIRVSGSGSSSPDVGTPRPVLLEDADALPGRATMPSDLPTESLPHVRLPVDAPLLEPIRVPFGDPVPVPGTTPQQYDQPVADIRPSPTTDDPWRVDVQPRTVRGTDPNGVTDVEHLDGTEAPSEPASSPGHCDRYPETAGCQRLGTVGPVSVAEVGRPMAITPDAGWGEGGGYACPADKVVDLSFGQITFPFALFCQAADMARPFVIAMGWLTAVIGFFGLGRRD